MLGYGRNSDPGESGWGCLLTALLLGVAVAAAYLVFALYATNIR